MFERILVPLDGSKAAELALPYAEELAHAFDSEVILLFVCDTPHCQQHYEHQVYIEKTAEVVTEHIGGKKPKTSVKPLVLEGHPAAEINDYAVKNAASLIIMATHGRSSITSWALGSIATKVLNRAHIPVLVIRAGDTALDVRQEPLFSRILLPLDGSKTGEAALPYIRELAEKLHSEVVVFQVVASGQHVHTIGGLDYVNFNGRELELAKSKTAEYLERTVAKLKATKATIRSEMKVGDTAQEIIKFADEIRASLVAMSSHGHSSIERWAFGSVTHKVLHNGHTPLLVVRAEAKNMSG